MPISGITLIGEGLNPSYALKANIRINTVGMLDKFARRLDGGYNSMTLLSYLGVNGMAEEWWSTISQRPPFMRREAVAAGKVFVSPSFQKRV